MLVFVEQKHIDKGVQGKGRYCPIAIAAKEQYGMDFYIGMGPAYMEEVMEVRCCEACKLTRLEAVNMASYKVDGPGRSFIADFDAGYPVKPTVVNLYQQPAHLPTREGWPEE